MILCMVVLGGIGNVWGVFIGAILLVFIPELLRDFSLPIQESIFGRVFIDPESLRMLLFGLVLILVMLIKPSGLISKK